MYLTGEGVKRDKRKAAQFYEKSCEQDDMGGCYALGLMVAEGQGVTRSRQRADVLFWKACKAGHKEACEAVR